MVLGQLPTKENSPPEKNKSQPLPTGTTIPRTSPQTPHQDNSPLGPLPQNKTTHRDQYLYSGELSWFESCPNGFFLKGNKLLMNFLFFFLVSICLGKIPTSRSWEKSCPVCRSPRGHNFTLPFFTWELYFYEVLCTRMYTLKHKASFGKSENLSKIFFAEILVCDHDYEGKSSSSIGLLWISFIYFL